MASLESREEQILTGHEWDIKCMQVVLAVDNRQRV
jgi:hypothetical protein